MLNEPSSLVYLDHSATTPIAPEVMDAMLPVLRDGFANPSGAYGPGRAARVMLGKARREIADCLGCAPHEIVLTSGGSESDNLALRGVWSARRAAGEGVHMIISAVEHEAVRMYVLHDEDHLDLDPAAAGFTVVVTGHTHMPWMANRDGVMFLNPGSAGPEREGRPVTLIRLYIDGVALKPEVVDLTVAS